MQGRYNTRSPAVKRLMKEAQELSEPTDQYYAQPLEDNLFEWHFTVRGPADSEFQHGVYHGRIILPVDYPMKPPSIIWLTPNGRFETNKKICLSISGHHPESWQPSWSIRTALLAIIGFMPTHGGGAIGSLDYTAEERKILAKRSRDWRCPQCGDVSKLLLERTTESAEAKDASEEVKKLAAQINFQGEKTKSQPPSQPATSTTQVSPTSTQQSPTTSITPPAPPASPPATTSVPPTNVSVTNTSSSHQATAPVPASHQVPTQIPTSPLVFPAVPPSCAVPPWGMMPPAGMVPPLWRPPTNSNNQPPNPVSMIPRFPFPPGHYRRNDAYPNPFMQSFPGQPNPFMLPPPFQFAPGNVATSASLNTSAPTSTTSRVPHSTDPPSTSDTNDAGKEGSASATSDGKSTTDSLRNDSISNSSMQDGASAGDRVAEKEKHPNNKVTRGEESPEADPSHTETDTSDSSAAAGSSSPGSSTEETGGVEGVRRRRPDQDQALGRMDGPRTEVAAAGDHGDQPRVPQVPQVPRRNPAPAARPPNNVPRVTPARFSLDFSTVLLAVLSLCTLFLLLRRIAFTVGWL